MVLCSPCVFVAEASELRRERAQAEVRAGEDSVWDRAENALIEAVQAADYEYDHNPGEGAFYGPKLEFVLRDAIGRDWQCGTLQIDFVLPERLDASYVGEDGERHRPVILHRAILGSFERFIGILIENFAGRFPFWLAPLQTVVATITDDASDYAEEVLAALKTAGIRAEADLRNEKINYKIREHSHGKVPIILVVGGREAEERTVAIRRLGGKVQEIVALDQAVDTLHSEAADIGIKTAIKSAKKTGIGLVAIKNSGHYGLSSFYAEQAVKKNLMVLCFTNAPPAIAPYGARKSLFGTNPICFGTPTGNKVPFILDTSVSMINRGKIRVAAKLGRKIPLGVALDRFGQPTTDAKKALKGVQLPIAGFRGSGLAWMVDIMSGVLTGAYHGGKVKDPFDNFTGPQNVGHLFLVLKPNLFVGKNYIKRIKENIRVIKKLPKIKGVKEILYPGQGMHSRYKRNLKKGIVIQKNILEEIKKLNVIK